MSVQKKDPIPRRRRLRSNLLKIRDNSKQPNQDRNFPKIPHGIMPSANRHKTIDRNNKPEISTVHVLMDTKLR